MSRSTLLRAVLAALLGLGLVSPRLAIAATHWTRSAGPELPDVLQFLPLSASTGLMATSGGIYKTTDNGAHWTRVATPALPAGDNCGQPCTRVLATTDGTRLYLSLAPQNSNGIGFYVSTDGGAHWTSYLGSGTTALGFHHAAQPIVDASYVYVLGESNYQCCQLMRSPHTGPSWSVITPPNVSQYQVRQPFIVNGQLCLQTDAGLFYSANGGNTWSTAAGLPANVYNARMAVDNTGAVAYLATGNELLFRSSDGCATWTQRAASGGGSALGSSGAFGFGADNALYVSDLNHKSLLKSTDGGDSFASDVSGDLVAAFSTYRPINAVGAIGGTTLAGAGNGGVFLKSTGSWAASNTGADASTVFDLAGGNGPVYAGAGVGPFATSNGGASWSARHDGFIDIARAIVPLDGALYVAESYTAGNAPVQKSTDGGATWTNASSGLPGFINVAGLATDGDALYLIRGAGSPLVYKSADGGASWQASDSGLQTDSSGQPISGLENIVANGSTLFVSAFEQGVYRSLDHGAHWIQTGATSGNAGENIVGRVYALPSGLYAGRTSSTASVLWKSVDNGDTWFERSIPASYLAEDANGTLYGAYENSASDVPISVLRRGANTWVSANEGQEKATPGGAIPTNDLLVSGATVYAATAGAGVWTSPLADPPGVDTEPNPFHFNDVDNASTLQTIVSNTVTITGIAAPAPVHVSGGYYSIGCTGSWTNVDGTIANNQTVCIRHIAAAHPCTKAGTALIVGGVTDVLTSTTSGCAADSTPDPFSFIDQNAAPNAVVTSNATTITGINQSVPISVSGGAYSIGCGATFTTAAGTIGDNQTVCVRHTAGATSGTQTVTTLTIGGVSGTFTSTVHVDDTTPDAFHFNDHNGAPTGRVVTSNTVTISGINAPAPLHLAGTALGRGYSINGGPFQTADATVVNGDTVTLRLRSATSASTALKLTLSIGGVSDEWRVTTGANDTSPAPFAFTNQTGVAARTAIRSNVVTISGINAPTPISLAGNGSGACQVNGGAFTRAAGTVKNGDTVRLKVTSAASAKTTVRVTAKIGSASATWAVTTQ
jgi:hypothetical protein